MRAGITWTDEERDLVLHDNVAELDGLARPSRAGPGALRIFVL